ncbi:unnamed protein product [Closterium sp. NIES-54]
MGAGPHHMLLVVAFLHRPAAHEGPAVEDGIQAGPRKLYALAGGGSGGGGCGGGGCGESGRGGGIAFPAEGRTEFEPTMVPRVMVL